MNAALEYRKRSIESASPTGLIVLLYSGAIAALMKAVAAIEANNIEKRVAELNRVLDIIAELQRTLNFQKGGTVAEQLDKFYAMVRSRVLEASIKNSKPILEELIEQMTSMRDAWQQVDRMSMTNHVAVQATHSPQLPVQCAEPMLAAR